MKYNKQQCLDKGMEWLHNTQDWPKCVDTRFSDIYGGLDCSNFIELVELAHIRNYPIADIKKELYNQGHSGCSYTMVKSMATHFYPGILDAFD